MSQLLIKSEENIRASELLISNSLFASSVHCSYYSTYQLIIYLNQEFGRCKANEASDSHNQNICELIKLLKLGRVPETEIELFRNKVGDLKSLRKKADYKIDQIKVDLSQKALRLSKELTDFLRQKIK